MNFGIILVGLAVACVTAVQHGDPGPRRYQLDVPGEVGSRQTHLLLRDVVVPRNRSIVLRVYAVGVDSVRVYLGSTAISGIFPDAQGVTSINELRINVTTGLRRWLARAKSARIVEIEITPSGGGDSTGRDTHWSVRAVEFVHPE